MHTVPDNGPGNVHNRVRDSSGKVASEQGLDSALLDHISTSQKGSEKCGYGAPLIAIKTGESGRIMQSCCNHWDCPRCRYTLAAYHRHKMIEGAALLAKDGPLWFLTLTCRGKELDLETADDNYLLWTNRLLSTCRAAAKKQGRAMVYVQVTERQQRGAAHSHLISTFCPSDAMVAPTKKNPYRYVSQWFVGANVAAGLGPQCDISSVQTAGRVATYISGYLKKHLSSDLFPKGWKRIRYSHGWPKTELKPDWTTVLVRRSDWNRADQCEIWFVADNEITYQLAKHHMFRVARPIDTT